MSEARFVVNASIKKMSYVSQREGAYWVGDTRVSLDSIVYEFLNGQPVGEAAHAPRSRARAAERTSGCRAGGSPGGRAAAGRAPAGAMPPPD